MKIFIFGLLIQQIKIFIFGLLIQLIIIFLTKETTKDPRLTGAKA